MERQQLVVIFAGFLAVTMAEEMLCYMGHQLDSSGALKWVLPYSDPCQCTEVRLGGSSTRAPSRPFAPTYSDLTAVELGDFNAVLNITKCTLDWTSYDIVGKPAAQSSSHVSGKFPAENAVDGSISPQIAHCSHTADYSVNPWWRVDLQEVKCVTKVTILNRGDCCSFRLKGAQVRAGLSATIFDNAACGLPVTSSQAKPLGGIIEIECDRPLRARYVSVDIPGSVPLQLCEVYVHVLASGGC